MDTTEKERGNILIAGFIGSNKKGTWGFPENTVPDLGIYIYDFDLDFDSSWDWQVPAFSKLAKEMRDLASKNREAFDKAGRTYLEVYFRFLPKYETTIFNNNPLEGFKILVENLTWFNQNKSAGK